MSVFTRLRSMSTSGRKITPAELRQLVARVVSSRAAAVAHLRGNANPQVVEMLRKAEAEHSLALAFQHALQGDVAELRSYAE